MERDTHDSISGRRFQTLKAGLALCPRNCISQKSQYGTSEGRTGGPVKNARESGTGKYCGQLY